MIQNKAPFENEYVKYWIKDGVIHVQYKDNLVMTVAIAKQIVRDRLAYCEGINYLGLADIRMLKHVDHDAMRFMASKEAYEGVSKVAIYSNSTMSKWLFNIWTLFDKPVKPTKYFTDLGAAYLYLKEISAN